jgi:hypothetical protein
LLAPIAALLLGTIAAEAAATEGSARVRPDFAALEQALNRPPRPHPRLFADSNQWAAATATAATNPRAGKERDAIIARARALTKEPVLTRTLTGRRLLSVSREAQSRLAVLCAAHRFTGDPALRDRAIREMEAVCAFTDWNPAHFLDTAEMACAVGIGYDWLGAALSPAQREAVRSALVRLAFEPSFAQKHSWIRGVNNWNQVCHGGLAVAALAIAEDEPEWARRIVTRAVESVPLAMEFAYASGGTYPEGPGYWAYGTMFNVYLIEALRSALGSDFGLARAPGFEASATYMNLAQSPSGWSFSYADSGRSRGGYFSLLFWFAKEFGRPELATTHLARFDARPGEASTLSTILLLTAAPPAVPARRELPLDWRGAGAKPVTMHLGAWNSNAVYAGLCAGSPSSPHGHMDIGSFVFDAQGVRWAHDLGMQGYHSLEKLGMKIWGFKEGSERWKVFRYNNTGHNTLVFGGSLQDPAGFGAITRFSDAPADPFTVVNLAPVYPRETRAASRGIRLPNRDRMIVVDEILPAAAAPPVRWAMYTEARVSIAEPRRAVLTQEGRTLTARILEPEFARWECIDASQPPAPHDAPCPGLSRLQFQVPAGGPKPLRLVVALEPGGVTPTDARRVQAWGSPADWR